MHIASIGIDLGKTTFHLVALGEGVESRYYSVTECHIAAI
jgi:hypothetical protein